MSCAYYPPSSSNSYNIFVPSNVVSPNVDVSSTNVVPSNIASSSEIPPIVESSWKYIISYTSPHVGEYKFQNQILKLPNIPSNRDMGYLTNSSKSKEPCIKPIYLIKEVNIMSTIIESIKEPHPYLSSCVPPKNLSKFTFTS